MKEEELGICNKCKTAYHQEIIYESHGCLGMEEIILIACDCTVKEVREYDDILPEYINEEIPF